jgi:hypothetical protein
MGSRVDVQRDEARSRLHLAATARLPHSGRGRWSERTNERAGGVVLVDVAKRKDGGRRDGRRWASDRLRQRQTDRQTGTKMIRGWRRLSTPEERLCSKSTRVSKFASSTLAPGACQLLALPAIRRALVCLKSSGARPHHACPSPDPCQLHSSQPVKPARQS